MTFRYLNNKMLSYVLHVCMKVANNAEKKITHVRNKREIRYGNTHNQFLRWGKSMTMIRDVQFLLRSHRKIKKLVGLAIEKKILEIPLTILGLRMKHEVKIAFGLMVIQFIYHFASKS